MENKDIEKFAKFSKAVTWFDHIWAVVMQSEPKFHLNAHNFWVSCLKFILN